MFSVDSLTDFYLTINFLYFWYVKFVECTIDVANFSFMTGVKERKNLHNLLARWDFPQLINAQDDISAYREGRHADSQTRLHICSKENED